MPACAPACRLAPADRLHADRSYPSSRRCVAKECRKVWQVAGLAIPAGVARPEDATALWGPVAPEGRANSRAGGASRCFLGASFPADLTRSPSGGAPRETTVVGQAYREPKSRVKLSVAALRNLVLRNANTVTLISAPSPWTCLRRGRRGRQVGQGTQAVPGEGARRGPHPEGTRGSPSPQPSPTAGRGYRKVASRQYVTAILARRT